MGVDIDGVLAQVSDQAFRLIRRIVRDRELALDLTQDVMVRLLRGRLPDDPLRLKGYAMRAAYHTALNAVRDRKRRHEVLDRIALESERPAPHTDNLEIADLRRRIENALDILPDKQRTAIVYRFYADLAVPEIAAAMGISDGAVKVHLFRGLQRLNVHLTEVLEDRI